MTKTRPVFFLMLAIVICFTLATLLEPRAADMGGRAQSDDPLKVLLGDGRRMFANHFYVKADVYFHSGYYPTIFDQARKAASEDSRHMTEEQDSHEGEAHEKAMEFLGQPKDWIDRIGRHFYSSSHSHLDKPGEAREILPWLRVSASLDPERIETYTVAAYSLRKQLGKVNEAEQFLREGARANPGSYEIFLELGKLYYQDRRDPARARNLWELALRRWREQDKDSANTKPAQNIKGDILANLSHLEEEQGNLSKALEYLVEELEVTPNPAVIQKRIDELKSKVKSG